MPFSVRKRQCEQSDGTQGEYVVIRTDTREQVSCHTTKSEAEQARSIRERESEDT